MRSPVGGFAISGVRIGAGKVDEAAFRSLIDGLAIKGVLVCVAAEPYNDRVTFEMLDDGVAMLRRDGVILTNEDDGDGGREA